MTLRPVVLPGPAACTEAAVLDVVVPVHNDETDLGPSVGRLHAHSPTASPIDSTARIAAQMARVLPAVG